MADGWKSGFVLAQSPRGEAYEERLRLHPEHRIRGGGSIVIRAVLPALLLLSAASANPLTELDLSRFGEIREFVVSDGVLYTSIQGETADSAHGHGILAMDIASGEELWFYCTFDLDSQGTGRAFDVRSYGDRIYALVYYFGLVCLERESGRLIKIAGTSYIGIPTYDIMDGVLYLASPSEVTAINLERDEVEWRFYDEPEEGDECPLSPSIYDLYIDDGRLYLESIRPRIRCLDLTDGSVIWDCSNLTGLDQGNYVRVDFVSDELVFVSSSGDGMTMLDKDTGEAVSSVESCGYRTGDDEGLFLQMNRENCLREIDAESGEFVREYALEEGVYLSDVTLCSDLLCIGSEYGKLYMFATDHQQPEELLLTMEISDSPLYITCDDERIYVTSESGDITCVDVLAGEVLKEMSTGIEIDYPFILQDGMGYFSSGPYFYVLDMIQMEGE